MADHETRIDGNYLKPEPVGAPRWEYPFRKNGDRISAHFDQDCWQTKATFHPQEFKIPHETFSDFYLISESEPVEIMAGLYKFTRTWARVPAQQIIPGSRFVTKPDLPGEFPQVSGNSLIIQPEENVPRWVFYTQKAVTSDSGVPNGNNPTGGTYTVTIGASTTGAIAYNASAATLQTALNALSSVSTYGSVTVTGSYTSGFIITFSAYTAATLDVSSVVAYPNPAVLKGVQVVDLRLMRFVIFAANSSGLASGTFTITIFGQTTAPIDVSGTTTDVKNALEALSNIGTGGVTSVFHGTEHGGATFGYTGDGLRETRSGGYAIIFDVRFSSTSQAVSASGSLLTPTGSAVAVSTISAGRSYRIAFTGVNLGMRILYSAAHGITALDGIVLTQGTNFHTLAAGAYSVTTDTIILTAASGVAFSSPTLITAVGLQTGNSYTAGTKLTRVKRVTDYYLPGVSEGITTMDDIPLPDYEGDAASLLTAIFDGDTDINYEVGELEFYRDGPILQRTRTTLDASQL